MTAETRVRLRQQLKSHEGSGPTRNGHFLAYPDTEGNLTIGYGHNLDAKGISPAIAEALLDEDLDESILALTGYPWFAALATVRQMALVDMMFNLGPRKLRKFVRMVAAFEAEDYNTAHIEMLDSRWARQVGPRAERLAFMVLRNEAPPAFNVPRVDLGGHSLGR